MDVLGDGLERGEVAGVRGRGRGLALALISTAPTGAPRDDLGA